jgi:hypothetical protein
MAPLLRRELEAAIRGKYCAALHAGATTPLKETEMKKTAYER